MISTASPRQWSQRGSRAAIEQELRRKLCAIVDGQPVSHSAAAFGFSRPSFYQARAVLERGGLAALVPR